MVGQSRQPEYGVNFFGCFIIHLADKSGPLACERMVDVLGRISASMPGGKSISKRIQRWLEPTGYILQKLSNLIFFSLATAPSFKNITSISLFFNLCTIILPL
jgi:hypothetical protein